MISEQNYRKLAEVSYWVDSKKEDKPFTPKLRTNLTSQKIKGLSQNFQVLKVKDNTFNGMQAMAVAPVDKNGMADYSEVVIVYLGINIAL